MKIGVDVDEVLLNTLQTGWIPMINEMTGMDVNLRPEDITEWDITKFLPKRYHKFIYDILMLGSMWKKVEPIWDSIDVLKEMNNDYNLDLYIVSSTDVFTPKQKWEQFLKFYPFIDRQQIIRIHNKKLLDLDYLIDDNPANLKDGDIVFTQPHNEWLDNDNIFRVDNLQDAYDIIKGGHK
jgi:5'(3')-deoxyribonucleotidase